MTGVEETRRDFGAGVAQHLRQTFGVRARE